MNQNLKSIGEWFAEKFGNNITKVASEGLTAEEYNSFEKTGAEIQQQLAGLATVTQEKEQFATANNLLTKQLADKGTENMDLQKQLDTANSELVRYKALYEDDANKGKGLPIADASSRDELSNSLQSRIESLETGHPDRVAYEAFLDAQAKNKK